MASQHRKHRGYRTQRLVSDYFVEQGWPNAYSVGAGTSGTDIARLPFDVEVKARTGFNPKAALAQIKARTNRLGFAVLRLNGQGEDVREYCAVIRFEDLVNLLKKAGYNNIEKTEPTRCTKCGGWMILGMVCEVCRVMTFNAQNVKPN